MIRLQTDELITLEDGYKYYSPCLACGGFSAHNLRDIADQLDEMNKDWDRQVTEDLHLKPFKGGL